MIIDSRNFNQYFPQIQHDIQGCHFLAFDIEFSGLFVKDDDLVNRFDSIEDQYQKCKMLCQNHHILQFGLSLYRFEKQYFRYVCKSYSFYLAPQEGLQMFQSASYKFLAAQGFDFNRAFRFGLEYSQLQQSNDQQQKKQLQESRKKYPSKWVQEDLQEKQKQLQQFLEGQVNSCVITCQYEETANYIIKQLFDSLQYSEQLFKNLPKYYGEKNKNNPNVLVIKKLKGQKFLSENQQAKQLNMEEESKVSESFLNFNKVIQTIIQGKKIMIGHNPCIDICILYHNFIADLPHDFLSYSAEINKYFPKIFDTKVIANKCRSLIPKLSNHIEGFYKECFENQKTLKPFNNVQTDIEMSSNFHDACYDAYLTGVFVVCIWNYIDLLQLQKGTDKMWRQVDFDNYLFKEILNQVNSRNDENFIFTQNYYINGIDDNSIYKRSTLYYEDSNEENMKNLISYLCDLGSIEVNPISNSSGYITFQEGISSTLESVVEGFKSDQPKLHLYQNRKHFKCK